MLVLVFPLIPKGQLYILFYSKVGVGEAADVSAYKESVLERFLGVSWCIKGDYA